VQEFFNTLSPELPAATCLGPPNSRLRVRILTRSVGWCIERVGFEDMTTRLALGLTNAPATMSSLNNLNQMNRKYLELKRQYPRRVDHHRYGDREVGRDSNDRPFSRSRLEILSKFWSESNPEVPIFANAALSRRAAEKFSPRLTVN
jgi:hypothetical protein